MALKDMFKRETAEEVHSPEMPVEVPKTPHEKKEAEIPSEQRPERIPQADVKETPATAMPVQPPAIPSQPAVPPKSPQLQRIESVLEADLQGYYNQMDEAHRKVFRIEGERTADQIDSLIVTAKATAKKILYLIQRWLRLIPGINKFFLEQEAKIKTDKIMGIAEETKNH